MIKSGHQIGNKTLVYRQKVEDNMKESLKHLKHLDDAFDQLDNSYSIPFDMKGYQSILANLQDLVFSDQNSVAHLVDREKNEVVR